MKRALTSVLALGAATAILVPGASSAQDTSAIVSFTDTPNKLPVTKKLGPNVVCSVSCNLTATLTLIVPGPNVTRTVSSLEETGGLPVPPGTVVRPFLQIPNRATRILRHNTGKVKLRVTVQAIDAATGATASIDHLYKFKR